jgi:hypothetical protein
MTTINVKIKREDKSIMCELLQVLYEETIQNATTLDGAILFEAIESIRDKLYNCRKNDSGMSVNLFQVKVFLRILYLYSEIGVYEEANARILKKQIEKKLSKKHIKI